VEKKFQYLPDDVVPGPGKYNPKTKMEDKLINKMKMGLDGKFGSTVERN